MNRKSNQIIELEEVIAKAKIRILYTPHAVKQMNSEDRMIKTDDVESVIFNGEFIEYYPDDKRGKSCLMCSDVGDRFIHVVCAPKDDYLVIITAYIPKKEKWDKYFKKRK